jgi:hypothetical protein
MVPAADQAGHERSRRREAIILSTDELHLAALSLSAAAAAACLRAQDTMRTSSGLRADAQRIRRHPDLTNPAA